MSPDFVPPRPESVIGRLPEGTVCVDRHMVAVAVAAAGDRPTSDVCSAALQQHPVIAWKVPSIFDICSGRHPRAGSLIFGQDVEVGIWGDETRRVIEQCLFEDFHVPSHETWCRRVGNPVRLATRAKYEYSH